MNKIDFHNLNTKSLSIPLLLSLFIIASCNNTFEPLQEDHPYAFSMYGYINVHADTQFVRVMPISKTLLPTDSSKVDYNVVLKRLSTGVSEVLDYKRIQYGANVFVRNFYSTNPIYPNETYELISSNKFGISSRAVITVPDSLPMPTLSYNVDREEGLLTGSITETDSLVYVEMYYKIAIYGEFGSCIIREVIFNHTGDEIWRDGMYRIRISHLFDLRRISTNYGVLHRKISIASASGSYPNIDNLSPEELTLPHINSNVSEGTGYVAGISYIEIEVSPEQWSSCS